MKKRILGAALGTCVHVSGLYHFLKLAESEGYDVHFAGAAVSPRRLVGLIRDSTPDLVAISYRLTADVAVNLFDELKRLAHHELAPSLRFIFGGTPPVAQAAAASGLFEKVFSGVETIDEIRAFLRRSGTTTVQETFAADLVNRIHQKYPYPLLRHHFGLPSLEQTIAGAREIAAGQVLDVLSLGPDQNAQEHFFHPEEMDPAYHGAGGVPVRKPEDLAAIYAATRCGNYTLLRCYSGTNDLVRWAEMSRATIHNAWGAIPLCWYSVLDGRSRRPIPDAIRENQAAIRWYAERGIPVEVNESHQWSLRDCHDALAVAMAFLAAYNAKKLGVRHYVSQYMFNTPPGTWPDMDLAKMTAKKEMIDTLQDKDFTVFVEVRAGIAHFSADPAMAKGQLAASAVISQMMKPHILHVVGFSEGDHAATAAELMESCRIIHGMLHDCLDGLPDMSKNARVRNRRRVLLAEAALILDAIRQMGEGTTSDPWLDAAVLDAAIRTGILDTPHFNGHPHACGKISTGCIHGAWYAVAAESGRPRLEAERLQSLRMVQNRTSL